MHQARPRRHRWVLQSLGGGGYAAPRKGLPPPMIRRLLLEVAVSGSDRPFRPAVRGTRRSARRPAASCPAIAPSASSPPHSGNTQAGTTTRTSTTMSRPQQARWGDSAYVGATPVGHLALARWPRPSDLVAAAPPSMFSRFGRRPSDLAPPVPTSSARRPPARRRRRRLRLHRSPYPRTWTIRMTRLYGN
jgi:hypothetical protein